MVNKFDLDAVENKILSQNEFVKGIKLDDNELWVQFVEPRDYRAFVKICADIAYNPVQVARLILSLNDAKVLVHNFYVVCME